MVHRNSMDAGYLCFRNAEDGAYAHQMLVAGYSPHGPNPVNA